MDHIGSRHRAVPQEHAHPIVDLGATTDSNRGDGSLRFSAMSTLRSRCIPLSRRCLTSRPLADGDRTKLVPMPRGLNCKCPKIKETMIFCRDHAPSSILSLHSLFQEQEQENGNGVQSKSMQDKVLRVNREWDSKVCVPVRCHVAAEPDIYIQ